MPCSVAAFTIGLLLAFSRKVNLLVILFLVQVLGYVILEEQVDGRYGGACQQQVVILVLAHVVMCFTVTMIWTSILYC